MIFFRLYFLAAIITFFNYQSLSQTAGISEINSIEAKVQQILTNREKIIQYKNELNGLEEIWKGKILKLKKQLDSLIQERDNIVADMKVGARCSECKRWKTDLEKAGINFEQHLGEVRGYAIPATTSELEATRNKYKELIAYKKVQIQELEKGDNALNRKKDEIVQLQKENDRLCQEITVHSKDYEKKVLAESEPMQKNWIEEIMEYVARKHIAEDKIAIGNFRLEALEKKFKMDSEQAMEDERLRTEEENKRKRESIVTNETKMLAEEQTFNLSLNAIKTEINQVNTDIDNVTSDLKKTGLSQTEKDQLTSKRTTLLNSLQQKMNQQQALSNSYTQVVTGLKNSNLGLSMEIAKLSSGMTARQEAAVKLLKTQYEKDKAAINLKIKVATADFPEASRALDVIIAKNWRKESAYLDMIVQECGRMVAVSRQTGCPVYNEVRFTVAGNYQHMESCANGFKHSNQRNYPSSGLDCVAKYNGYKSVYTPFARSLDSDEIDAVRKTTFWIWFESFYK